MSLRTPLSELHLESGAIPWLLDGFHVQGAYGDLEAEVAVLREGSGLVDRSWIGRLEMAGEDRHRFLNGLTSGEVNALAPGESRYTFLTNGQGRVLADVRVLALEDRLWLELPPGRTQVVRDHLSMYVVADRVEIFSLQDLLPLTLVGPRAATCLEDLGVDLPAPQSHGRRLVLGTEVQIERAQRDGSEWLTLWVSSGIAAQVWSELLEKGATSGLVAVGLKALECLRIEAGTGRWGHDFDGENVPQETGLLEVAVDFDKGCYLGQEIVARIHYRGKPKRVLVAVDLGDVAVSEGAAITVDGSPVGVVTSVAWSARESSWLGLANILREVLDDGADLSVDGRRLELR